MCACVRPCAQMIVFAGVWGDFPSDVPAAVRNGRCRPPNRNFEITREHDVQKRVTVWQERSNEFPRLLLLQSRCGLLITRQISCALIFSSLAFSLVVGTLPEKFIIPESSRSRGGHGAGARAAGGGRHERYMAARLLLLHCTVHACAL